MRSFLYLTAALGLLAANTGRALEGDIRMHDPSTVVTCAGRYWVYSTGPGIAVHSSADGKTWQREPAVFKQLPAEVLAAVPKNRNALVWAPDVAWFNGSYHLYYAVSSWGSEVSAIGLATSPTLDPRAAEYCWTDRGIVVQSVQGEKMNAIDPCVLAAPDGRFWLTYGSYIGTVNVIELDPSTGLRMRGAPSTPVSGASEASALIFHSGYYYLLVNRGSCCKGVASTYHIMVGRSSVPQGPYRDRQGRDMLAKGGDLFLASEPGRIGPGHFGLVAAPGPERFSIHYEAEASHANKSVLDIRPLSWDAQGWPIAGHN